MHTIPMATSSNAEAFPELVPWIAVLLVVVVVGAISIAIIRRMTKPSNKAESEGFTLADLRELHAAGDLSDEEFERAKAAMVGRVRARASENSIDGASSQ